MCMFTCKNPINWYAIPMQKIWEKHIFLCAHGARLNSHWTSVHSRKVRNLWIFSFFFVSQMHLENAKIWENFKHIIRDKNILLIVMHSFHSCQCCVHITKNQFFLLTIDYGTCLAKEGYCTSYSTHLSHSSFFRHGLNSFSLVTRKERWYHSMSDNASLVIMLLLK